MEAVANRMLREHRIKLVAIEIALIGILATSLGVPPLYHALVGEVHELPLAYVTIEWGRFSGITDFALVVLTADGSPLERTSVEERWQLLWAQVHEGDESTPPAPEIDFSAWSVIGAFGGERAVVEIVITEISEAGIGIIVGVREKVRVGECGRLDVLYQPYHLVKLPRPQLQQVDFEVRTITTACGVFLADQLT